MALSKCCSRSPAPASSSSVEITPMEWPTDPTGQPLAPESHANPLSRLLFWWVQPLFSRASHLHRHDAVLQDSDLIPLPLDVDGAKVISEVFETSWDEFEERCVAKRAGGADQKPGVDVGVGVGTGDGIDGDGKSGGNTGKKSSSWSKRRKDRQAEKAELHAHLRHSLLATMDRRRLITSGLIKLLNTCIQFTFPLLLNAVLRFIEDSAAGKQGGNLSNPNKGYWLSLALFLAMASKAVTENTYFHMAYRCGYHARVAVSASVYNKALRLSGSQSAGNDLGELVNLMQVDATKIEMFIPQIHVLWDGIVQIVGYMVILYFLIGWPCFVGLVVMVLAGPVQGKIMGKLFVLNRRMVKHTDARVKTTNEALQGIQCVKMYTWEDSFEAKVAAERKTELGFLKNVAYLRGFSRAYMSALPGIVAVVSFVVYAAIGGAVTASTLFAALAAFDQLRFPLLFYPMALAQLAQAKVSADRVANFLGTKEMSGGEGEYLRESTAVSGGAKDEGGAEPNEKENNGEIVVEGASVYWSDPAVPVAAVAEDRSLDDTDRKSTASLDATDRKSIAATEPDDELAEVYPNAILSDISFRVDSGQLTAVIGRVGCGKSSLCSAVLNEAILGKGLISVKGTVAYAAQSAWILNATVRDNILFGKPLDKERYDAVIEACQLTHDLSILNDGDLTEIGERGINLSGGQKQRISIARAAYSNADVMILDDPLSALDPAVGQRLFNDCILGLMKGKTRLLVTNQLQCLKRCDKVVSLGNGRVIEQGTYEDLMNDKNGEVLRLLNELKGSSNESDKQGGVDSAIASGEETPIKKRKDSEAGEVAKTNDVDEKKMITKEERATGAVKLAVYKKYLLSGGGLLRFACVYFGFILCSGVDLLKNIWISVWTSDSTYQNKSLGFYMGIYAVTAVALGIFTFWRSFLLARFGVNASENLHNNLLASVLKAPQSFFDTTPLGRIISRFSKDMHSIDQELSDYFDFFLSCSLFVVVSLGTITFATPWFGVAILPLMVIYIRILNYFRDVSRETKRLDSISRSPVYAHFSETLGGLSTIRAYEQPTRFIEDFTDKLNLNTKAYYCNKSADRWLSVRLELIGSVIAGLAAVFAAASAISQTVSGLPVGSNFASLAGLSLTYAISVTGLLNWCVRSFAQLEAGMNATERVLFYTEDIPQEAPRTSEELEKKASSGPDPPSSDPSAFAVVASGGKSVRPAPEWPTKGALDLNNLVMRYRPETPIVLKGLSVSIAGGERIGVVGRTGSGKSSLLLSLMRIVEPELTGDKDSYAPPITIDGVDVLRIGLKNLRSKLGIIPQNPVLFSGTFRSNLDPFNEFGDGQIWNALGGCGMRSTVELTPGGLEGVVTEYGENLSQGQRQLLCLGRALLKQCQILLLDEATSSVDFETDREIQHTLRSAFAGSTVLTIAHRTNTIMDSDKILVMKDGVAEEFAPPKELLSNDNSLFSEIVRHAEAESENH
mmetsp:Transcript_842/g.2339  ORF Transcript_842/g.2339 Transcript_842/m.2339 type:complete len:1469 (-) Transcript_842:87-4493(-)